MKQKIEWYREVLELEPGSRVFFPLAKLLAADGQTSDAVFTLKQGLLRHPDHVEARLLLVELLFLQNAGPELQAEIDGLGGLFASYPGFWSAWSERLSGTPALHDAALAMRFFSAALQGKKVSWGAIIEHGLQSMLGTDSKQDYAPYSGSPSGDERALDAMHKASAAQVTGASHQQSPIREEQHHIAVSQARETGHAAKPHARSADVAPEDEEEENEEAFSLRTRSMADVLAEQGDYAGALEIYQELQQQASKAEAASLQERIDALASRLGTAPVSEESATSDKNVPQPSEGTRLVNLLESLADRLEARAR